MELSEEQFRRYARHLILDEVGEEGQEKLLRSRVLVIGAGGLGSPLLLYLVAAGVAGIMVSSADPKTSSDALNRIGSQVALFTTDSDAPETKRVAYIGSSNTDAGKQAGELVLKALPNGGKCMGFVGLLGADNAKERIQGVRDTIKGSKVTLVDVRGDDIDQTRAKRNVEDTLTANPDINCMIGFYSYNTPRIYEALKDAGKLKQITVIGFDEDPITLGGVKEGTIFGTVVQQPYQFGLQAVALKDKSPVAPSNGHPGWAELKEDFPTRTRFRLA